MAGLRSDWIVFLFPLEEMRCGGFWKDDGGGGSYELSGVLNPWEYGNSTYNVRAYGLG